MSNNRDEVFISYSHVDAQWLKRLQTMLKPLERAKKVTVWADTHLRGGQKWHDEIQAAIGRAKVAVLLVSPPFLASDFIAQHELPPLLDAAENEGLTILWIAVSHSVYEHSEIEQYQAANNPNRPLDSLPDWEVNKVLADVVRQIQDAVNHNLSLSQQEGLISNTVSSGIRPPRSMGQRQLLEAIRSCSAVLRSHRNTLGRSISSLKREVTDEIITWLQDDHEDNVAVLLDAAGMGKSVVLRATLEELESRSIPVLAIKADKQLSGVTDHDSIQKLLDLPARLEHIVSELASLQPLVILIDQIDALSLSMARDQRSLDTVLETIARLRRLTHVRLLLACRTFDLNTDPRLSSLDIKRKFSLSEFSEEQVQAVVETIGIQFAALSPATRKLLRTPLHLDLFVIAFEGQVSHPVLPIGGLHTLQELYQLLWNNVVLRRDLGPGVSLRVNVLRRLTARMDRDQKTSAPHSLFTSLEAEPLVPALEYLASVGILIHSAGEWSFLHQTFFDYCFARFFVEDERSLSQEVLKSTQGLFERPKLHHVLSYLRGTDHGAYIREFTALFESLELRVHLCELLREWFGALPKPSDEEWLIARQLLVDKTKQAIFLRAASGNLDWYERLQGERLSELLHQDDTVLDNEIFPYLRTLVNNPGAQSSVIQTIKPFLNKNEQWDNRIAFIVVNIRHWYASEAIEVCEYLLLKYFPNARMLSYLLDDLAKAAPHHVLHIIRQLLNRSLNRYYLALSQFDKEESHTTDTVEAEASTEAYEQALDRRLRRWRDRPEPLDELNNRQTGGLHIDDDMLKVLIDADPVAFLDTLLPYVEAVLPLSRWHALSKDPNLYYYPSDIFSDMWSLRTTSGGIRRHDFGSALVQAIRQALLKVAENQPTQLQRIVATLAALPFETPQRLLVDLYRSNPEKHAEEAWRFLITDNRRFELGAEQFESRRLIRDIVPYLTSPQRLQLEARILAHSQLPSYMKQDRRERWMLEQNGVEQWRLLRAFTNAQLSLIGRKRLQELDRKYYEPILRDPRLRKRLLVNDELPDVPITGAGGFIGSPIDGTAVTKMSDRDWIKAMRHYQGGVRHKDHFSLRGGAEELARSGLKPLVTAQPERFHRLAMAQVPLDVDAHYIRAIVEGLAESVASSALLFDVVRRFASQAGRDLKHTIARALEKRTAQELPDDMLALLESWVRGAVPADESEQFYTQQEEDGSRRGRRYEEKGQFSYYDTLNGGPFMDYISSSRGAAFSALMDALTKRGHAGDKERRWGLIEAMIEESSDALRAGAVNELLSLLDDDRERAINVFEQLVEGHPLLLRTEPVHHFLNWGVYHFPERVKPMLLDAMNDPYHNVAQKGAALACIFALRQDDTVDTALLDQLITGSTMWRRGAAEVFANSVTLKLPHIVRTACITGMIRLLNDEDEQVRRHLGMVFHSMGEEHIFALSPFVEAFVASVSYGEDVHDCNQFLWKHSELRPDWSFDQIEAILRNQHRRSHEVSGIGGEALVRLTLRLYTTHTTIPSQKERAIELFGQLMERFGSDARRALEEWDRR